MIGLTLLSLLSVALLVVAADDGDGDSDTEPRDDPEFVDGSEDADTVETGSGDDTVFANDGADLISTNEGDDRVFGGDGDDLISGGSGDDFLRGGADDDEITAGAGEDTIFGDAGDDVIDGTEIFDVEGFVQALLNIPPGGPDLTDDEIAAFFDFSNETGEADTLNGGVGNDLIFAGSNDVVDTGDGFDEVIVGEWVSGGDPVEITSFSPTEDVVVYSYEEGNTPPDLAFGETADGTATLEADGEVVATFGGVDVDDLIANTPIFTNPIQTANSIT